MPDAPLLTVDQLRVRFSPETAVVRDVSFEVNEGEIFGLVGESGSGKSLTCRAIMALLPIGASASGRVVLAGRSLLELPAREWQRVRGSQVGLISQDPMSALNPVLRVGDAIAQVVQSHGRLGRRAARAKAIDAMRRVGIPDPEQRARSYPHEFSGGMRQRIVIAMALAGRPRLLLADEPTTALDVVVQAGILDLLRVLRREENMGMVLVSHDLGVIAGMCDRIGVMYAGELIEVGPASDVLTAPRHPYTRALTESHPEDRASGRLRSIPGAPPDPGELPPGCAFHPRCRYALAECRQQLIPLTGVGRGRVARCIRADELQAELRTLHSSEDSRSATL
jgi:oligopeptide/dipeptide ABC transporter ATP-binding protein